MTSRMATIAAAAALAAMLCVARSEAAQIDVAEGRKLAETWCAECHVVAPTSRVQSLAPGAPPDFAAIARAPTTTEQALTVFLQTPHARMPDFQMSREQIHILVSYILSLWNR